LLLVEDYCISIFCASLIGQFHYQWNCQPRCSWSYFNLK